MHNRAQHQRWADGRDGEIRLLLLDEVPRGFLSKGLGCAVSGAGVLDGLFFRHGVPVLFAVDVARCVAFVGVDDAGEGRGNDHAGYAWGVLFDGGEDALCALYGGVEEVFLGVGDVEMEGGGGVWMGGRSVSV